MFCEESFGKMPSFPGTVDPRILSLESVDYFARSEYLSGPKKKRRIFMSEALMVRQTTTSKSPC